MLAPVAIDAPRDVALTGLVPVRGTGGAWGIEGDTDDMLMDVLYAAAAIGLAVGGAGVFWACWQVVQLMKTVQTTLLPNIELTLTEVQKNLNRIDELTKDVDTTVEEANQLVHSANRTVQSVENGLSSFNRSVTLPAMITLASAREGVSAAWQAYKGRGASRERTSVAVLRDETDVLEVAPS